MRTLTLSLLCFILSLGSLAQREPYDGPSTKKKSVLFIQPLSLIVGGGELGIEHLYMQNNSIRLMLGYFYREDFFLYGSTYEGFRAELQHRFYLSDDPLKGNFNDLYVSPYLYYKQIEILNQFVPGNRFTSAVSGGLLIGYQKMFKKNFTGDFFIGGGYLSPNRAGASFVHIPVVNPYRRGIFIRAGFAFGLAL